MARVTNKELAEIVKSFASNKAPGPDGITNVNLKAAVNVDPDMFRITKQHLCTIYTIYAQGIFPKV